MTQAARTSPAELRRVALDLDHIRTLGRLCPRRLESLALAATEMRALADFLDPAPPAALARSSSENRA